MKKLIPKHLEGDIIEGQRKYYKTLKTAPPVSERYKDATVIEDPENRRITITQRAPWYKFPALISYSVEPLFGPYNKKFDIDWEAERYREVPDAHRIIGSRQSRWGETGEPYGQRLTGTGWGTWKDPEIENKEYEALKRRFEDAFILNTGRFPFYKKGSPYNPVMLPEIVITK